MQSGSNINANFPSRYRVESQLGEGAAGIVYLALDTELGCKVVIKALKHHATTDPKKVARFHNEFNALKNCIHQNIIRVFDFSEFNGLLFYTMEYLQGKTLHEAIYDEQTIPLDTAIEYLIQIAQGLAAVHQRGLIHRDLKPSNIFITDNNTIKLLDFGIARLEQANFNLTTENELLGTPYYMSPEQNAREAIDLRSDIYSFGVLAFELVTKQRPYQSNSQFDLTLKHLAGEIPSARELCNDVPKWLDAVITTCMQKSREKRYDSMEDIISFLQPQRPDAAINANNETAAAFHSLGAKHTKNTLNDIWTQVLQPAKRMALTLLFVTLVVVLWSSPVGHFATITLLRSLFFLRGETTPPNNIVIVALDDITYQELSLSIRQPFPRKIWAQVLNKIHETKPAVVLLDGFIQKETHNEDENILLENAIKLGPTVLMKAEIDNHAVPEDQRTSENSLKYFSDPRFSAAATLELPLLLQQYNGVVSQISMKNKKTGMQTIRERVPLSQVIEIAGIKNWVPPGPQDLINFYGPPGKLARISVNEVMKGSYNFENKIVFAGYQSYRKSDAPGSFDSFVTSGDFYNDYFGVEIHATIAANLLDGSFIKRLPPKLENLLLVFLSGFLFYSLLSKKPSFALKNYFLVMSVWGIITTGVFMYYKILLPGLFLLLGVSVILFAAIWYFYANAADDDLSNAESITRIKLRKRSF